MCDFSVQRSAIRARSLTEELEETHQLLKEAQERVSRTQGSFTELVFQIFSSSKQKHQNDQTPLYFCLAIFFMWLFLFYFFIFYQTGEVQHLKIYIRELEDKVIFICYNILFNVTITNNSSNFTWWKCCLLLHRMKNSPLKAPVLKTISTNWGRSTLSWGYEWVSFNVVCLYF